MPTADSRFTLARSPSALTLFTVEFEVPSAAAGLAAGGWGWVADGEAPTLTLRAGATGAPVVVGSVTIRRVGLDLFRDGPTQVAGPFCVYVLWGLLDALVQCLAYWLCGQLSRDLADTARWAGYLKFTQCIAAVGAWLLGTGASAELQVGLNMLVFVLALPGAFVVAGKLSQRSGGGGGDGAAGGREEGEGEEELEILTLASSAVQEW